MAFRNVSGAIFNPAIGTALWVVGVIIGKQQQPAAAIVCFTLSDLLGGALAGIAVRFVMNWRALKPLAPRGNDFDSLVPSIAEG
eukprot:849806-Prymnesium_polylepis.4